MTLLLCLYFVPSHAESAVEVDRLDILRNMSLYELSTNVKIYSASRQLEKLNQAAANIQVIDGEQIARMGSRTLGDLLWTVAGIQVHVKNNNRFSPWVRGVTTEFNNKVLLLVDGVPYRDLFGGFPIDEELPLENIKRIEILKGPGSALYGANAFSGIISMFTYDAGEKKHNNLVKAEVGTHQTRTGYARMDQETPWGALQLQAKYFDTHGHRPERDRLGNSEHIGNNSQGLEYFQLKTSGLDNHLKLNALFSKFDNYRVDKGLAIDNQREHQRYVLSLDYDRPIGEQANFSLSAYHNRMDRLEQEDYYETPAQANILQSYKFIDDAAYSGINFLFQYDIVPSYHTLVGGVDIRREKLLAGYYDFIDYEQSLSDSVPFIVNPGYENIALMHYGLYLQDSYSLWENTTFTAGLRYDILELFNNQLNYRLGLSHEFNSKLSGKLLYGTAYRSPNFVEFTRTTADKPLPDVETMETLEAQLRYFQTENSSYTLSIFHNQYQDSIQRIEGEWFGNVTDQEIHGVELETRFRPHREWDLFANFSWLHGENSDTGEEIPLLADWTLALGVDWTKRIKAKEWSWHNHLVVYGPRKTWPDYSWSPGQTQRHPAWSPSMHEGFAVWYTTLRLKGLAGDWKGWDIALTLNNVLDKTYYSEVSFFNPDIPAWFDTQYDPRQIFLSVAYNW